MVHIFFDERTVGQRDLEAKAILTDFHGQGSDYTYTATTANEIPDLIKMIVED